MVSLDFLLQNPDQPKDPLDLVDGDRVEIVGEPNHAPYYVGHQGTVLGDPYTNNIVKGEDGYVWVNFEDELGNKSFWLRHVRHIPNE